MIIKLADVKSIIDPNISLVQRGILITAICLREKDTKLTLAKLKASINMRNHVEDLIHLHKEGYIEWSGFKTALKSLESKKINPQVIEVIDFMNALYKTEFRHDSKAMTTNLINRLNEYNVDQVKLVVSNRYLEWKDDKVMSKYLNPTTLFRPTKFEKYLEEANRTKKGQSITQAEKFDIKDGQIITVELSVGLIDSEMYSVSVIEEINSESWKRKTKMSGVDLKKSIWKNHTTKTDGNGLTFKYIAQ